jgi:membrane protein implicated in regulation of membrane protease activity
MDTVFTPELLWVLAGIVMLSLELFIPGLVIIFFGGGALLTALATALGLTRTFSAQLLLFIVSSLLLLALLRRLFQKIFIGKLFEGQAEPSFDVEIGRLVDVREAIAPETNRGKVFYHGAQWEARSADAIPAGGRARIVGRDNITLLVEKINPEE